MKIHMQYLDRINYIRLGLDCSVILSHYLSCCMPETTSIQPSIKLQWRILFDNVVKVIDRWENNRHMCLTTSYIYKDIFWWLLSSFWLWSGSFMFVFPPILIYNFDKAGVTTVQTPKQVLAKKLLYICLTYAQV